MSDAKKGHYVYLYRDRKNNMPVYVGYGARASRAFAHTGGRSHNKSLNDFLASDRYQIDVVGPFGNEEEALRAETLLISAFSPLCNVHKGQSAWRFRALGLPPEFADRRDQDPLTEKSIKEAARDCGGIILVLLNQRDFSDGREGYDPSNPMSDVALTDRASKYWQLAARARKWVSAEEVGPTRLLALFGPPSARFVVGSWDIRPWKTWKPKNPLDGGLIEIPVVAKKLDAGKFRGTRIERDSDAFHFGQFRHQQFILFDSQGHRHGGKAIK